MRRNAGVSLVEVVIASAILAAVVLMAYVLLASSTSAAAKGSIASDLEARGRRLVDSCREEFLQARFTGSIALGGAGPVAFGIDPNRGNTSIGFQMPGQVDASGTDLGLGRVVYGYRSPAPGALGFRQGLACFLRFEADSVFKEGPGSPAAQPVADWGAPFPPYPVLAAPVILNADVNRDGDQLDTFVRGRIRRYVFAPFDAAHPVFLANGGACLLSVETVSDQVILRVDPGQPDLYNGNVDSDAAAPPSQLDPLFQFVDESGPDGTPVTNANVATQGRGIVVTVWHGTSEDNGKGFLIRKNAVTVRFRNTQ